MKKGISKSPLIASLAVALSLLQGFAQDTPTTPSTSASTAANATAATAEPVKLPYGVEDVLKMSRAQVSDDIIATYIQNTGTIYNLGPNDIVYLKDQGVSDRIVNTMLDQRRIANEVAAQAQQQQAATQQPAAAENNSPVTTPAYSDYQPATQAATQPAASSLYVIPYPTRAYPYYGRPYYSYSSYPYYSYSYPSYCSYPYSYGNYCYGRPVVGFRFGVGRSFHATRSFHHR